MKDKINQKKISISRPLERLVSTEPSPELVNGPDILITFFDGKLSIKTKASETFTVMGRPN